MSEKLKCEIIKDLLPSYVDGLTSEITNEEIRKHLDDCKECAALLDKMQEPEQRDQCFAEEVDYLKKVKNRTKMKVFISILSAVILVVGIFTWRVFIYGFYADSSEASYTVSLDGNTVTVSGMLTGSGDRCSHIKFTENEGVVTATAYIAPVSIFGRSDKFTGTYTAKENVKTVYFGDVIAYENGNISRMVAKAYKTKTAYVGDISADNRVAKALGIETKIGDYTNELQTTSEPYGWTLRLKDSVHLAEEKSVKERLTAYSYVMLYLIDNLGSVSWEYKTDNGTETLTITEKDASAFVGKDIKSCSDDITELQNLMSSLGVS